MTKATLKLVGLFLLCLVLAACPELQDRATQEKRYERHADVDESGDAAKEYALKAMLERWPAIVPPYEVEKPRSGEDRWLVSLWLLQENGEKRPGALYLAYVEFKADEIVVKTMRNQK